MPLVEKTHNRTKFYKYMSAETAEVVLKNNTLRWSSPELFNDPFDVPRELAHSLNSSEIMEAIVSYHLKLYRNPPNDLTNIHPKLQFLINTVRQSDTESLIKEIEKELRKYIAEEHFESKTLDQFREQWINLIPEMRILCLCESHKKTSMWYHYANEYTGAVIEFLCPENIDAPWRIAKPIEYTDENHIVSTPEGWAQLLSMRHENALDRLFETSVYTKSEDWSYEHEWRVASFKRQHEYGSYSDYPFDRESIGNLYLGPLINDTAKNKLISASKEYEHMNVYESKISVSRKITFNPSIG